MHWKLIAEVTAGLAAFIVVVLAGALWAFHDDGSHSKMRGD